MLSLYEDLDVYVSLDISALSESVAEESTIKVAASNVREKAEAELRAIDQLTAILVSTTGIAASQALWAAQDAKRLWFEHQSRVKEEAERAEKQRARKFRACQAMRGKMQRATERQIRSMTAIAEALGLDIEDF